MKIQDYQNSLGEYTLPEGLREELEGKSIEEQIPYFRTACYYQFRNTSWSERTEHGSLRRIDEDNEVKAIIVDNGIIVGVMVRDYNFSKDIPCFVEQGVCTYYASDNNGAGYKEREDYFFLYAVAKE